MILETFLSLSSLCCIFQYFKQKNIEKDNQIDALTGLYNRKVMNFIKKIDNDKKFSVIAYDIDKFKNINDTYGHSTGDIVLKSVAEMIHTNFKSKQDYCVRFGGEEFFTFIDTTNIENTKTIYDIANRIRKKIEELRIVVDGEIIKITISIGIAHHIENSILDKKIEISDERLYFSKKNGRNQVTDHRVDISKLDNIKGGKFDSRHQK